MNKIKMFGGDTISHIEYDVNHWLEEKQNEIKVEDIKMTINDNLIVVAILYEDCGSKFNNIYWLSQDNEKHLPKDMTSLHIKNSMKMLENNYGEKCSNFKIYNIMKEELKNRKEGNK